MQTPQIIVIIIESVIITSKHVLSHCCTQWHHLQWLATITVADSPHLSVIVLVCSLAAVRCTSQTSLLPPKSPTTVVALIKVIILSLING